MYLNKKQFERLNHNFGAHKFYYYVFDTIINFKTLSFHQKIVETKFKKRTLDQKLKIKNISNVILQVDARKIY